ncbi:zinc metallopeptidase [Aerococcaceae bacterium NML190938]|nr:zinc metallopeptidase [Aerococcaceae bacterium NML190938]
MYGYYFDPTYILVLLGAGLAMYAQHKVQSTFAKYDELETRFRITGNQAAREILQQSNLHDVRVEHINGHLTDHYDPRNKVLRLSDATDKSTSIAAVAVAAHECGHAVQDAKGYVPLRIRSFLVSVTQFGSTLALPMIFIGLAMGWMGLVNVGIIAFALVLAFQLVTLPVEFDASNRAMAIIEQQQLLAPEELQAARKVLNAAALTYVASTISTALQLLRFILIANSRRRD